MDKTRKLSEFPSLILFDASDNASLVTNLSARQLISSVAQGTSPLLITSNTLVANLNADLLDGQDGSYYLSAANFTGSLADARLSSNVALKNINNSFSAAQHILAGNATSGIHFLELRPTDYTTGKPALIFKKNNTNATQWDLGLWDGSTQTGTLDLIVSTLTKQGQTIWHAGNDGSSSGLDADLLDGVDGANYVRSDLTGLGKVGNQTFDSATNSAAAWALLPVGYARMMSNAIGTAGGSPVNNYGYFTKVANRDSLGGWGGLWVGYAAGENYLGRTATNGSYAVWEKIWTDTSLTNLNQLTTRDYSSLQNIPTTFAPAAHTLDSHSNVTITANSNGEILRWTGTAWINNTLAEAGIQPAGSYLTGNQTISLTGDVTGSGTTSIATTLATVLATKGGTGFSSYAIGDMLYASSTTALSKLAIGATKTVLTGGTTPSWVTLDLTYLPDAWAKRSVKVASTGNLTLSAPQTIDGVSVIAGDRVLVKNQTTASQNGIYDVAVGSWTRVLDGDIVSEIAGATVNVDQGTVNGGKIFRTTFKGTDTINSTNMIWYEIVDSNYLTTWGGSTSITTIGTLPSLTLSTLLSITGLIQVGDGGYSGVTNVPNASYVNLQSSHATRDTILNANNGDLYLRAGTGKSIVIPTLPLTGGTSDDILVVTTAGVVKRVAQTSISGASNLDALTDVVITTAANTQYLRYNGTNWVNSLMQSGDITTALGYTPVNPTATFFLGTTSIAHNRASAAQALTGITSIDGSAATLTTARTITIGSTGKTFNGSANVSWSLAEIGAQAAGSYLTAEADTLATVTGRGGTTGTKINVTKNTTDVATIYTNGHFEAQVSDGSFPSYGFHRAGIDAVALHYRGGNDLYIKNGSNTNFLIYTSANLSFSTGAVANNLVQRDANGYTNGSYFNSAIGNETSAASAYYYETAADGYIRKKTLANAATELVSAAFADQTTWSGTLGSTRTVGQLKWKNYGNGHTIFDASAATSPTGSAINASNSQNTWIATHPSLMGWNGSGTYGVKVDCATWMVGRYKENPTASCIIWTIGTDWMDLSTHYGLGYSYNTAGYFGTRHEIVLREGGTTYTWLSMDGFARFSNTVWAAEFVRTSSRTTKENIIDFEENALPIILDTKIKNYTKKLSGEAAIGFIAEDTHPYLSTPKQNGHDFGAHLSLLTKAIQEEDTRIKKLEEKVNTLEAELAKLKGGNNA